MTTIISPRVTLLDRDEWGASQFLYRLGGADDPRGGRRYIGADERTHHFFHHSVIVDNDVTKNIWETLAEVKVNMRVLQRARPDLGGGYKDVPYNWVVYLRPNEGKITVCEGRGSIRSGAHTGGRDTRNIHHNISALATCVAGNTELGPGLVPWVPAFNDWLAYLKSGGFNKIDELHPPTGARVGFKLPAMTYGHRHVYATACPGENMWRILPQMSFEEQEKEEEEEEEEMLGVAIKNKDKAKVYVIGMDTVRAMANRAHLNAFRKGGLVNSDPVIELSGTDLATILKSYGQH